MITEAVAEFNRGNWNEALVLFERAHVLVPSARTLRGLRLAEFEAHRYVSSVSHLSAALDDPRQPLTAEQREATVSVLTRARSYVARVALQLSPERARLQLNGQDVELPASGKLGLDPGSYELSLSAPGHVTRSVHLEARSGDNGVLALALEPTARGEGSLLHDALVYGGLGTAAVALGVGVVTGVMTLSKGATLQGRCDDKLCPVSERSRLDSAHTTATLSNVAFGVTVIAAAVGVVGLVLVPGRAREAQPGVALDLGPGSARLQGQF